MEKLGNVYDKTLAFQQKSIHTILNKHWKNGLIDFWATLKFKRYSNFVSTVRHFFLMSHCRLHSVDDLAKKKFVERNEWLSPKAFSFLLYTARLSSDIQCAQHRGQRLENRTEAIICCNSSFSRFKQNWQREGSLLTELLVTLKNWDCPQFVNECQQPSYNFTDFTSLVYENACNQTVFRRKCFSRLQTIVWKRNLNPGDWGSIVRSLLNLNMEEDELTEACVQVALYEAVSEFRGSVHGYYHEIKRTLLPFCDFVWCGLDAQNVHDNWTSAWMCMPPR